MNARQLHRGYSVLTLTRQDLKNLGFTREQVEGLTEGEMQLLCTLLKPSQRILDTYVQYPLQ